MNILKLFKTADAWLKSKSVMAVKKQERSDGGWGLYHYV